MPELAGERRCWSAMPASRACVGRVIEHLLDEALDGLAGLVAQVLGDPALLQAGLVDQVGDGGDAGGRGQRQQQR